MSAVQEGDVYSVDYGGKIYEGVVFRIENVRKAKKYYLYFHEDDTYIIVSDQGIQKFKKDKKQSKVMKDLSTIINDNTTHNEALEDAVEGLLSLSQVVRGGKHHSKPITRKTNRKRKVRKTNRKRKVRKTNRRKVRRKKNTKRMTRRKKSIRNGGNPICGSQSCSERSERRRNPPTSSAPPIVATPIVATHVPDDPTLPVVPSVNLNVYKASRDAAQRLSQEEIKPDLLRQLYHVYTIEIKKIMEEPGMLEISEKDKNRVIQDILDNDHMYGYDRKHKLYSITQADLRKYDITFDVLKRYIDKESRFT